MNNKNIINSANSASQQVTKKKRQIVLDVPASTKKQPIK